jgi:CBS domain containing-hemolysin-like protein
MNEPAYAWTAFGLVAVAALVLINAYFVASEFALVAVRRSQLKLWAAEGRRGARSALQAVGALDDAIAATQLGITLASLGLGWLGEPAVASLLKPVLEAFGMRDVALLHTIATVFAFSSITFLHVVAGELAPKAFALDRPGDVALWCARPLLLFGRICRPALVVMNGAGNALVRGFGVAPAGSAHAFHSSEELSLLVDEARQAGALRADTGKMLGNVFRLSRTRVRDVMVERDGIKAVERGMRLDDLIDFVRRMGTTRIPVVEGGLDHVVGVLHAKDLFHVYEDRSLFILDDVLRPVYEIAPDLPILEALRRFRADRAHMAIVRDRGRPVVGLVTLEDVLEEIVGEIEDEYDVPTKAVEA